jgi:hypothetical protein
MGTEYEMCVSDVTLEAKKASMMWKHPSYPQGKKFQAVPPPRRIMGTWIWCIMATVFGDYKCVLVVDVVPNRHQYGRFQDYRLLGL